MTAHPWGLLDSNVVIAVVAEDHEHHIPSKALFESENRLFAVAAHSFAEAYSNLTRRGGGAGFRWSPEEARQALESVVSVTRLVGLSPAQTLDTIRAYSSAGGIGPRLYDRLIGQVAVQHAIPRILTWNVAHFSGMFPDLEVFDPATFIRAG